MPGLPADHQVPFTSEGKLTDTGFVDTWRSSDCWACGEASHRRKPGLKFDIWRCECGTEWQTPTKGV